MAIGIRKINIKITLKLPDFIALEHLITEYAFFNYFEIE